MRERMKMGRYWKVSLRVDVVVDVVDVVVDGEEDGGCKQLAWTQECGSNCRE